MTSVRNEPMDRGSNRAPSTGISPMAHIVAKLDGGPYYMISEASEMTGVPISTLRRWLKKGPDAGGTKAPSKLLNHLGSTMYLYTNEDLKEIALRKQKRNAPYQGEKDNR